MKILIVNGYVRENKGDAALMSVLAHQLQEMFPGANILISDMEDPEQRPFFEGFKNVGSMRLYTSNEKLWKPQRVARKLLVFFISSFSQILTQQVFLNFLPRGVRGELSAIKDADIVIAVGGGCIIGANSLGGNLNIYFLTLPLRLAEKMKKMVVLAPQSYGPFGNKWQERLVLLTLNSAHLVCVREDISLKLLKELGVKKNLLHRTVDSGFGYSAAPGSLSVNDNSKIKVGITARNWLKGQAQKDFEKAVAGFIFEIESKYGANVVLVPQVTSVYQEDDDRIVHRRINDFAVMLGAKPVQVIEEIELADIKKLYSTLSFIVGARFHSIIFSLTSYVPAIVIKLEHKASGMMHDLALDEWVIKIEDVTTEKLVSLFDKLFAEQVKYKKHLQNVLPNYIQRTDEVPRLIKEIYDKHFFGVDK